jgi:hypothetical protein
MRAVKMRRAIFPLAFGNALTLGQQISGSCALHKCFREPLKALTDA